MSAPAYGVAMRNFTRFPEMPDAGALIDYGVRMEDLGFESLWVWDHILLGTDPNFPIIDSLSLLTAVAARTKTIKIGTGVLVLPLRNPVTLAKQLSSIDLISNGRLMLGAAVGWYKREFDAVGIPYERRGKIMDRNLDILKKLWTEDSVTGEWDELNLRNAVMFPKPVQKPHPPILIGGYVDVVLKRVAKRGDGWLTYFYTPEGYNEAWAKISAYAEEEGRDPASLYSLNQLPIYVGPRDVGVPKMNEWLNAEWDLSKGSLSTFDSAIVGTPAECAEQIARHIETGVKKIVFVPWRYEKEQVDLLAHEVLPLLRK
ncbi:LLM class flavin-dependent oxidoreductase [Ancylobacter mangrovi]|uniref:TIGR03619 family F420-dependent LLM class oxidoreductase n=1 Tax=Ancylobacter mangrovi TaxID=2972472 RepID=A0A9X2PB50_9HYPH|nr:TIGR03619 family F420-dependent LLM class oxidoreductase [Ancylobacter mangrovi]MCS0493666.1 TIGR03619 family F420-dependent LLM class oxidoreductase [Ancylobacter mangrovi]MCS0501716.1 TIGR03619 family F420-dependent LLM class oxidoreductase [Ancylobacter mangrovi]